jgi:hypothetical protein
MTSMGCRNLMFMLPRSGYASARDVADALARALKRGSCGARRRILLTTRTITSSSFAEAERPHWCFRLEASKDLPSHRAVVNLLRTSPDISEGSHINYCSNCGEYWFEHRKGAETFQLGSLGPHLCGDVEKISIEYPQRGLSFAQLKKLEEETDFYKTRLSALDIGQRMFYGVTEDQFEWRGWECWALEAGKAELASLDGEPFLEAKAEGFPEPLLRLERAFARR